MISKILRELTRYHMQGKRRVGMKMLRSSLKSCLCGRNLASEAAGGNHTVDKDGMCAIVIRREQVGKCCAKCGRKGPSPRLGALSVRPNGDRFIYYVHFFHFILSVCNLTLGPVLNRLLFLLLLLLLHNFIYFYINAYFRETFMFTGLTHRVIS